MPIKNVTLAFMRADFFLRAQGLSLANLMVNLALDGT